jgi:nucleotidyltransferase/DNA polymerase involved in DNA repair
MVLGEALARCPSLCLIPADPACAAELWDRLLERLEGIGAAVESGRPGEAFFTTEGLRAMYGGEVAEVIVAARLAAQMPVRIWVAPNRFAAFLAAGRGKRLPSSLRGGDEETIVPRGALSRFLAPYPVTALGAGLGPSEPAAGGLVAAPKRLGLRTLGTFAALSSDQVADRFGQLGLSTCSALQLPPLSSRAARLGSRSHWLLSSIPVCPNASPNGWRLSAAKPLQSRLVGYASPRLSGESRGRMASTTPLRPSCSIFPTCS